MQQKRVLALTGLFTFAVLIPVIAIAVSKSFFTGWSLNHESLHSTVEAIGAFTAFILAAMLLVQHRYGDASARLWVSSSMFATSLLDILHSIVHVGQGFVFLRLTAAFLGSVFISLVWLPEKPFQGSHAKALPIGALFSSAVVGAAIIIFPAFPGVVDDAGVFTPFANILSTASGVLYLAASIRFVTLYYRSGANENFFFAALFLLFSIAAFFFPYSRIWSADWWLWHFFRLSGFIIVLIFVFLSFEKMTVDLEGYRDKLLAYSAGLELKVEERTSELKKANEMLKASEEKYRKSEERFKTIFNTASVSLWEEDVTQIKSAIERLKASGMKDLRSYMEDNPGFLDEACRMVKAVDVNDATVKFYNAKNKEELLGPIDKFLVDESRQAYKEFYAAIAEGRTYFECETVSRKLTGERIDIFMSATLPSSESNSKNALVSIFDITKLKQAEEELLRISKIESIGIFAGGIAHDFNNLLAAILGNIAFSKLGVEPGSKTYEKLSAAEHSCGKAKELSTLLITFAEGGYPLRSRVDLARFLPKEVAGLLTGSEIKAEFSLPKGPCQVDADEGQLRRVIANLVENAKEAMPGGGFLRLRAENLHLTHADNLPLPDGKYVKVSFQDAGGGIPKENLSRIFDPYFTTKELGSRKGMGLGLSICHSIIKRHGGFMTADSEPGKGAEITFYLPLSEGKS